MTDASLPPDAPRLLRLHPRDTVAVALTALGEGEVVQFEGERVALVTPVPAGHKFALVGHGRGSVVVKYGRPIGHTTGEIAVGEHVHLHNLESALGVEARVAYAPREPARVVPLEGTFSGYRREDGRAATRNELWIVPTVGCVAGAAERMAAAFRWRLGDYPGLDGVHALRHPLGCSQTGEDLAATRRILSGLVTHPNAGGVLLLGLGCENNPVCGMVPALADEDPRRWRAFDAQAVDDEEAVGLELLAELAAFASEAERTPLPVCELVLGLKCGGSDGFSGLTANPLLGRFTERLVAAGGTALLGEVPEMFGAEAALFGGCLDRDLFERAVAVVQEFRRELAAHGEPVHRNPSPGNQAGGITTLEEKALGCVQKAGDAPITDVLEYGARSRRAGVSLLATPGNDPVSTTALVAAGATLVLFTTGRGTPLGSPAPVVKVASNRELARRKRAWIDFDAGRLVAGASPADIDAEFEELVLEVASGRRTASERNGERDIAILKRGVTL